jgi:hypothetical protein
VAFVIRQFAFEVCKLSTICFVYAVLSLSRCLGKFWLGLVIFISSP